MTRRLAAIAATVALLCAAIGAQLPVASPEATAPPATAEQALGPVSPEITAPPISAEEIDRLLELVNEGAVELVTLASGEVIARVATPEPVVPEPVSSEPIIVTQSHDPAAIDLLEQMAVAHENLETLEGTFRQHKHSVVFLEDIRSTGRFKCRRPDHFRYDYDATETTGESTYWLVSDTLSVHIPELQQLEIYYLDSQEGAVGHSIQNVMIGLDGAVDELRTSHWIRTAPLAEEDRSLGESVTHLVLEPQDGVDSQGFTSIELWVDTVSLLPVQVKMIEESGDTTTLTLTSLTRNPPLDDAAFDPLVNIPDGTEIIEPQ
jgi:outer membrane lipoprotein-sorting protein